jgi:hypothetical protein
MTAARSPIPKRRFGERQTRAEDLCQHGPVDGSAYGTEVPTVPEGCGITAERAYRAGQSLPFRDARMHFLAQHVKRTPCQ